MGYDDRREIFQRLAALERMRGSRHDQRGGDEHGRKRDCDDHRGHGCEHDRDRDHDCAAGGGGDFDEKRIIDTIVRLVSEQVCRILEEQQAKARAQEDGGGEKRLVDLIVGLVSEHVQEIVASELDRRLGRPPLTTPGTPPPGEPA
jgi:hypothetical protein